MDTKSFYCGLLACREVNKKDKDNKFVLLPLPYAENALEPHISEKTVQFHYGKHLRAYIDKTNELKAGTEYDELPLHKIILQASGGLFNNAAQVFNHYFYFETFRDCQAGKHEPSGELKKVMEDAFGSFEDFKEKFAQAGTTLFGSGWVWLAIADGKPEIIASPNAENPLKAGKLPLLALDVWEHAYYLDTQNARAKYIEHFWKVVNWEIVERRFRR